MGGQCDGAVTVPREGEPLLQELALYSFRDGTASGSIFDVVNVVAYHLWVSQKEEGEGVLIGGLLELLTRSPPWLPAAVWLPIAFTISFQSSAKQVFVGIGIGVAIWSFMEYVLHRFAFHFLDKLTRAPAWCVAVDFLSHGVHHRFPTDFGRLVMPLSGSIPIAFVSYLFVTNAFPLGLGRVVFAGILLGYVSYDTIHFLIHKGSVPRYLRGAVRRHARHHFGTGTDFGVTTSFWDVLFGTVSKKHLQASKPLPRECQTNAPTRAMAG